MVFHKTTQLSTSQKAIFFWHNKIYVSDSLMCSSVHMIITFILNVGGLLNYANAACAQLCTETSCANVQPTSGSLVGFQVGGGLTNWQVGVDPPPQVKNNKRETSSKRRKTAKGSGEAPADQKRPFQ